ncbi:AAA family ATPase [Clostridium malenominatum]|uniref:Nuclease SbcCD subunit C n=1 Tax=Clostridium malenominatum TaxID=1539 RepID=A0ABN1J1D2_9CLOT
MKPKLLKVKGLNSFLEEQKIDFSKLTEKGLFGIFGPTGSGKSTILDAITLTLYGEISRASKNDKGFINTNTDYTIVSLEFEIGEGVNRKTYIAERNISKDKQGAYKTKQVRLLLAKGEDREVIAEKATEVNKHIENTIGLSLDDFTRSVVLPQGKFSEFLKLTGTERRNMLERIFNLEKYGRELTEKVRLERNKNLSKEGKIEGELKAYEGVTEEGYKALALEIEEIKKEREEIKEEKKKSEEKFNKYKEVWNLQQELVSYQRVLDHLKEKLGEYEENKVRVDKGQRANNIKGEILSFNATGKKLKDNKENLIIVEEEIINLESNLKINKENFNRAEVEKNTKIPELIKKEGELEQVIKIISHIEKLKEERKGYAEKWNSFKRNIEIKEKEQKNINDFIENIKKELTSNEEVISKNKVEPNFRNKLQLAIDVEKEYKILCRDIEELELQIEKGSKIIIKNEEELLKSEELIKENEEKLSSFRQNLEDLKSPGDNSLVNEKQKSLIEDKNNLWNLKEKITLKKGILRELEEVKNFKEIKFKEEENLEKTLGKLKENEETLKKEIDKILEQNRASALAKDLKEGDPCPVCGATHHEALALEIEDSFLNVKEEEYKYTLEQIKALDEELRDLKFEIAKANAQEESLVKGLNIYKDVDVEVNIEGLIEKLKNREKEIVDLEESIKNYMGERDRFNSKILEITEKLGKINSYHSSLYSQVLGEKKNKTEKEEKLLEKRGVFLEKEKEYLKSKEELKVENLLVKMSEVQEREKKVQILEEKNHLLKKDMEEKESKLKLLMDETNIFMLQKQEVETRGKALKEQIDEKIKECSEKYSGEHPEKDLIQVQNLIIFINKNYEDLKEKYEETNSKLIEISKKKESFISEKFTLESLQKDQLMRINVLLEENNFLSIEEVMEYSLEENLVENLKKDIKDFEEKYAIARSNVEALRLKLKGESIAEEEYKELEIHLIKITRELEEKHDAFVKKSENYREMKEKLEKCKDLLELRGRIRERLDTINQIDKLIQGNRFVEYVAKHQLKYIAKEASKRLKSISRDRYSLEIDEESNFIIVDDYNGGERRNTTTLSGGETFLASLALALALSSQIQLKGNAPLEFFFLDEGFGTLDSELLDIVMSSLERLHNDKLSVGIISHVEELKQRIPVKLIVTPSKPGEGGTKVKIDY